MALREGEEVRDLRPAGWVSGPQDSAQGVGPGGKDTRQESQRRGDKARACPWPTPMSGGFHSDCFIVGSVVLFRSHGSL